MRSFFARLLGFNTIPTVEAPPGYPEELRKPPPRQISPPSLKGKRRSPQEVEADRAAFVDAMVVRESVRFEYDRKRAKAIGITTYQWVSGRGDSACAICRERNGKTFSYDEPDGFDHPGMVRCCNGRNCACVRRVIVKGFN